MRPVIFRALFLLLALGFSRPMAHAETPSATAVLTSSETALGRPVALQIKVTGAADASPPQSIAVDGLDIRYSGQSQESQMRWGPGGLTGTYSFIYNYTVMPMRAGTFKIPAVTIKVGGDVLKTPELTLHVGDAPTRSGRAGSSGNSEPLDERKIAFAELIVTKKSAYVGEMVPVEIRLAFNARIRSRLTDGPAITGQGFTTQKMPQPQQDTQEIDGKAYQVLTFKTAIAAARTGKFEIGPVEAKAIVQVPRHSSGRPRSPFDIFNMNDPFADSFFNDPFSGAVSEQKELALKSEPATLEVKPLPANAPPGFSGAVGQFTMAADVNPKRAQVGDPLTVTGTISGRGNFDRVTAPALEDERGWHKYPPSGKFKQDDDIGISGTKSFEMVLSPNENKTALPPLLFTYFDPVKQIYVPLRSDRMPIRVDGGAAPTPPAVANTASSTPAASAAPAIAQAKSQDILYQLTEHPTWNETFDPLYAQPIFWTAQAVPLLALLGFAGFKLRQSRRDDRAAQRLAALQQEAAELHRKLNRDASTPAEYFAGAARAVQVKTALRKGVDPGIVDAGMAAEVFHLDAQNRSRLEKVFAQSDELQYSGARNGNGVVTPETRREIHELLSSMEGVPR